MADPLRVLQDPPQDGPTNMAADETLLVHVGDHASPPTLRLYQWANPTISLGYFQPFAQYERLLPPAGDLPVVRRMTGGGAILHDLEVTYSLTIPAEHAWLSHGPAAIYELMHEAISAVLSSIGVEAGPCGTNDASTASRGPFFCFERRHRCDLLVANLDDRKIAGSAQRRTRKALLQHGSIILANRFPQQETASVHQAYEPHTFAATARDVGNQLPLQLARLGRVTTYEGNRSEEEIERISELHHKYAAMEWIRRF